VRLVNTNQFTGEAIRYTIGRYIRIDPLEGLQKEVYKKEISWYVLI